MTRDSRFDVLFETVQLGPVSAPNRFYQVPHCTGMGYALPKTLAAMREVKAEGGWGVVNTEYCSIHPTSDDMPYPYASLWDSDDVRNMASMTERVHRHGALAGVELWHGGQRTSNLHSREPAFAHESMPTAYAPWQSARMDLADIRAHRQWHRAAALRACEAGFDVVYAYAAHTYLLAQFLDPAGNRRDDSYGGSLENRSRMLVELLEDMRRDIGDKCAIAVRVEVLDEDGTGWEERCRLLQTIAPLVDLFDVTVPDYEHEMGASRFVKEASLEGHVAHVRSLTGKPVVSVGRFTSPETMLSQVRRGIIDLIGAARPSIADPFLPNKIREGRFDDIRECIGCNICYAHNSLMVPLRCTQNPTMGEEWRRDWHPERVSVLRKADTALIVGAGPAGLEAAVTLGRRGVQVMLAEAGEDLGGRVSLEARLPGLAEWARVRDWRVQQLSQLANVDVFRASLMTPADVLSTDAAHVLVATGSHWRADGRGTSFPDGVASFSDARTLTPDAILKGARPDGPVVIFDDEGYYMAASMAELLATQGLETCYVTPQGKVAAWTHLTHEQIGIQRRLIELGVTIITGSVVDGLAAGAATIKCIYTGRTRDIACAGFVPVTSREPNDRLWVSLKSSGLKTIRRIGDCLAPGIIAQAVYDGHKAAREFGEPSQPVAALRERALVSSSV